MNFGNIRRKLKDMGFHSRDINNIIETLTNNPPEKDLLTTEDIICYLENN